MLTSIYANTWQWMYADTWTSMYTQNEVHMHMFNDKDAFLIHRSKMYSYVISHVWLAAWSASQSFCMARASNIQAYVQTFQPNSLIQSMLAGNIDLCHFVSIWITYGSVSVQLASQPAIKTLVLNITCKTFLPHTCHTYRHQWLLFFSTMFSDPDPGWESHCQWKAKPIGLIFSHHCSADQD